MIINKLDIANFMPNGIGSGHTPYRHDVSQGDIGFITIECVSGLTFNKNKLKKITNHHFNTEFSNRHIVKNSVVCTIKRRICQAYPFFDDEDLAFNQDIALLIPNSKVSTGYLATYLSCNIGQKFAHRQQTEQMNPYLSLVNLSELPVAILSFLFQKKIDYLALKIQHTIKKYNDTYIEAETLLLTELDLLNFKPSTENIAIKSFSESFGNSGRLDSEYYQPKYDELIKKIETVNHQTLGDIVSIKKSIEPGSEAYQEEGIPFVRVSNLNKFEITQPSIHLSADLFDTEELEKLQPKKDTILLSKDGTVGIAYTVKDETNIITSGALLHLTIKNDDIRPEYLTLVLNSLVVQMQSERDAGGSIIKHWKPSEIEEVLIPIIDLDLQIQIEQKIKTSFKLKAESKQLLDLAKLAVEMATEQNEEAALEYIENQTKELNHA